MIQKIKLILATLTLTAGFVYGVAAPVAAQGASGKARTAVCEGITATGNACTDNGSGISNVIQVVINILSLVAGVAAVIMIIIGGLRYITSGGDSSKVASAKTAIIYAIVGLVIVLLSQIIVRYVLQKSVGR